MGTVCNNLMMIAVYLLLALIEECSGFWFYGYDQVYRDPYSETTNNDIVQTSVITYLASSKNVEIVGLANPYTYKLILFESILQYETSTPSNEWNLGILFIVYLFIFNKIKIKIKIKINKKVFGIHLFIVMKMRIHYVYILAMVNIVIMDIFVKQQLN